MIVRWIPGSCFGAETGRACWMERSGKVGRRKTSVQKVEHDLISLEKTQAWWHLCQGPFSSSNLNCLDQQVSWESWNGANSHKHTHRPHTHSTPTWQVQLYTCQYIPEKSPHFHQWCYSKSVFVRLYVNNKCEKETFIFLNLNIQRFIHIQYDFLLVQHFYQTTAPEIISPEHLPSVVSIFRQTAESLNSDHSQADTDLQSLTSERGKGEKRRRREKEKRLIPSGPTHTQCVVGTVDKSVQQRACTSALWVKFWRDWTYSISEIVNCGLSGWV